MRKYEVELLIYGSISTKEIISFNTDKELDFGNVFNSEITIRNCPQGIRLSTTVYTTDTDRAYKVALLFIGKMLDILSVKTNIPLIVTNNDFRITTEKSKIRAQIDKEEFKYCFETSRFLNLNEPIILRSFNWYRKGLYTEDPFDKFLALWNSIEVIAAKYHTKNERTKRGIINQIWNCFESLWGNDVANWIDIDGDINWINDNNEIRNNIAHGVISVEIHHVEEVIQRIEPIKKVAYRFLLAWANKCNTNLY